MKVLKDNFNPKEFKVKDIEDYPRKHTCYNCYSELQYDETDMAMGYGGYMEIVCPLCGGVNALEDNEHNIKLTPDNIEFPVHFWHTCKENGAVDICNTKEIREYLRKAIDWFRKNKDEYHWHCRTGNLYISVSRFDRDRIYEVILSNNYYEVEIPFEKVDY